MSDNPRTLSRTRKLARKVTPLPVRRWFVRTVDRVAGKREKPGRHHLGGASR